MDEKEGGWGRGREREWWRRGGKRVGRGVLEEGGVADMVWRRPNEQRGRAPKESVGMGLRSRIGSRLP